jgi:uncharacterized membrane protein YeiB
VTDSPLARHARVTGLDVARALALFGMFAAHVANDGTHGYAGWEWLVVTHGRSAALFALLAGVSIALMLTRSPADDPVRHTRIRVAVRGGMLIVLGWILSILATPVDIILDNLGVMFLMVLVAFRWRPWALIAAGAAFLTLGREVVVPLAEHLPRWLYELPVVHELWSFHYPALIWVGYVLIGMGLGKLAPWRGRALAWLTASGLLLAVIAYGTGTALWDARHADWTSVESHSYTAFETLGNVGVACVVIGACCWIAGLLPRVAWPLAAAGSMTLTVYSAQIVMIALVGPSIVYQPTNAAWIALCLVSVAFACVWRWRVGQGPLENVFTVASTTAADSDARRRARVSGSV